MTHYLALIPRRRTQWRIVRDELDLLDALTSPLPFATVPFCGLGRNSRPGVRSTSFGGIAHSTAPLDDPLSRTVTNRHGAQQHIGLVELGWRAYRELVG